MSKEFFLDLVVSQVCLSAIHSFPFLGSDHEVLFDNAWNFKLNVHYSAQQHLDHLISITIELLFDCGKFIRDSRNLITNSLHFRVQLKYITKRFSFHEIMVKSYSYLSFLLFRLLFESLLHDIDTLLCLRLGSFKPCSAFSLCCRDDFLCLSFSLKKILYATVHILCLFIVSIII